MTVAQQERYDTIIIGAGIAGLVAGCYLAKAGMKVLISEQHSVPGGYCTTFKRKGFLFDAAAHSFGSYRKTGIMFKVLHELGISELHVRKFDPSDVILAPEHRLHFYSDTAKTTQGFQDAFPHERSGVGDFFDFLLRSNPLELIALRNSTFQDLLNRFFRDHKLRSILAFPVLGNSSLPPSRISAFTAIKIYTEFLLDGGYYPDQSMQSLSDALAERFKLLGGELLLSTPALQIVVDESDVKGVVLDKLGFLPAEHVISGSDARQTFLSLVGAAHLKQDFIKKLDSWEPSLSVFVVYLGIDQSFDGLLMPGVNVWFMPHYDVEHMYEVMKSKCTDPSVGFMFRMSPNNNCLQAFVTASFRDQQYWREHKKDFLNEFIAKLEKVLPGLRDHIVYKEAASPWTMHRYTKNYQGAAYGWASIPTQFTDFDLKSGLHGLYLTGHWSSQAQGIPGAAFMGFNTARVVLKRSKRNQ
jgi:phytoene dehydrogenase-like protein